MLQSTFYVNNKKKFIFYSPDNHVSKKQMPVLLTVCTELSTGITFKPVLLSSLSTSFKVSNHKIDLHFQEIPGMSIDLCKSGAIKM